MAPLPTPEQREKLSKDSKLTFKQVTYWCQNIRKYKRMKPFYEKHKKDLDAVWTQPEDRSSLKLKIKKVDENNHTVIKSQSCSQHGESACNCVSEQQGYSGNENTQNAGILMERNNNDDSESTTYEHETSVHISAFSQENGSPSESASCDLSIRLSIPADVAHVAPRIQISEDETAVVIRIEVKEDEGTPEKSGKVNVPKS